MKWTQRRMVYCFVLATILIVLACGQEPPKSDDNINDVYATANARIDEMQTTIAENLTAQAIKKAAP